MKRLQPTHSQPAHATFDGADNLPAVVVKSVSHRYGKQTDALKNVSVTVPAGTTIGLVGPDGVGKSTLMSLIAGMKKIQTGTVQVLGKDMGNKRDREQLLNKVAFMPQGLGHNLYPTLSVMENIDFHARLFSIDKTARQARIDRLLAATDLLKFKDRPAGKLSGGMKQKLSLCCALVHDPDLLILDEPTTGVDPLSRQQFWTLVNALRGENPNMTVMVSTAYIDEASQFAYTIAMNDGEILISDTTENVVKQYANHPLDAEGRPNLEEAYNTLLPENKRGDTSFSVPPFEPDPNLPPAIEAENLTKRFGDFVAVNHVSFSIAQGEIFGFLGSNGCGKSTTMKMLTGLLDVSEGTAYLLGEPVTGGSMENRLKVGYMSQAFSLYEELSVRGNLKLHARLYRIPENEQTRYIEQSLATFDLADVADKLPADLPLGIRQRLQLAAACLHQPKVLILDEPTSGVDPAARDMFWKKLVALSRDQRITIFVSTHFMSEALRCDRISLMHQGNVLAVGKPRELQAQKGADTFEEAFIAYLVDTSDDGKNTKQNAQAAAANSPPADAAKSQTAAASENREQPNKKPLKRRQGLWAWLALMWAFANREGKELRRDKIRLSFALIGPVVIMLTVAYAVSFDINHLNMAVIDYDQSTESRELIEYFDGSPYFSGVERLQSSEQVQTRLKSGDAKLILEIPSHFAADMKQLDRPEINFYIDGSAPFIAENIKGYVTGILLTYARDKVHQTGLPIDARPVVVIEPRFLYNQGFASIYAIIPGTLMLALILIPAMMTALGVVREKELGSITNLYTSPASTTQFLVGKQIPYILTAFASYFVLVWMAIVIVGVPVKGSFVGLTVGALLLVCSATAFGLWISSMMKTQVSAVFATAVAAMIPALNFSGFLYPLSSITGPSRVVGELFPAAYFQQVSLGAFTKGLGIENFARHYLIILGFGVVYVVLASLCLQKQEQ